MRLPGACASSLSFSLSLCLSISLSLSPRFLLLLLCRCFEFFSGDNFNSFFQAWEKGDQSRKYEEIERSGRSNGQFCAKPKRRADRGLYIAPGELVGPDAVSSQRRKTQLRGKNQMEIAIVDGTTNRFQEHKKAFLVWTGGF